MIGEKIVSFETINSTNRFLMENHTNYPDGTVVVALKQTSGYGRNKRIWYSPKGGLWFSVLFKPRKQIEPSFYTRLFSVSVVRTLEKFKIHVNIKWPNDIYLYGRKLAGVLSEGIFEGKKPVAIVVGVGINVNNDIPEELKTQAISLKEIMNKEFSLMKLLEMILKNARILLRKYTKKKEALTRIWKRYLIQKEGDILHLREGGQEKLGRIVKITSDYLLIEIDGEIKKIYSIFPH
ncbi:biotin--[acetyl-CoA-carboxylase] ligase [Thermotoga sp. KOL6]|uniref:biotin--[acetyl-CoA-carboxylase] ligase n=1 Tax=Thermotoga sp. KOL6 TaxID=126741 RepID=UPI000C7703AC|nr:biotin--[acetyl-CoA-carboxylase] ligase [Thermotoga sp. KOL6]PLV58979.1 biotin--acetyl-CoA-carboxylase ligase [Thermotoga sp. KOL6]